MFLLNVRICRAFDSFLEEIDEYLVTIAWKWIG